jgi:hypothetical protein
MPSESPQDPEIAELEHAIQKITRYLRWAPWLGLSVFAAIPAGYAFGELAAWTVAVTTASVTGNHLYNPYMHRFDHRQRLHDLQRAGN